MPVRKIKLNKYKHKKSEWITPEIIQSIKFRDNMYERLKQTSQFNYQFFQLKQNLKVYNKILKRIIREAKLTYYNLQFRSCQSDPRKKWDDIRSLLNDSKSKGFPDYMNINNVKINDKNIIVDKISEYFGNIGNTMSNTIPIKNKD